MSEDLFTSDDVDLLALLDYNKIPMRGASYNERTGRVDISFLEGARCRTIADTYKFGRPVVDLRAYKRSERHIWKLVREHKPPRPA